MIKVGTSLLFATAIALSTLMSVAAPAQAADQWCRRASQCKGPLPMICMYCQSLQKSVCAHWACVHHTCEVQICPEYTPYKPW
jgi:hypothetical protein